MPRPSHLSAFLTLTVLFLASACSGGGGGGDSGQIQTPLVPANVPPGTGLVAIDMSGTWITQDAVVVETNNATQAPPPDGTPFALQNGRVISIAGLSVAPGDLSLLLGPLTLYVNQLDGVTLFYAVTVDNRGTGGTLETVGLAGGSVDADTVAVESYVSTLASGDTEPRFLRARFQLKRVSAAPSTLFAGEQDPPLAADEVALLRAQLRAGHGFSR